MRSAVASSLHVGRQRAARVSLRRRVAASQGVEEVEAMIVRICVMYSYEIDADDDLPTAMAVEVADLADTLIAALDEDAAFVRVEVVSE